MRMNVVMGMSVLALAACKGGGDSLKKQDIGKTGWSISLPSGYRVAAPMPATAGAEPDPDRWSIWKGNGVDGDVWVETDDALSEEHAAGYCLDGTPKTEKLGTAGVMATCTDGNLWTAICFAKAADGSIMAAEFREAASQDQAKKICASLAKK